MERVASSDFVNDVYPSLGEEQRMRIDLAATYNLLEHFGMSDSIYTHISARLPGVHDRFLINPYGTRFGEVTASNLVTIDLNGKVLEDPFGMGANPAGFTIHSAVHAARPDVRVLDHLGHFMHALEAAIDVGKLRFPFDHRLFLDEVGKLGDQAALRRRFPLPLTPFRPFDRIAKGVPELFFDRTQRHEAAILGAVDIVEGGAAIEIDVGAADIETGADHAG